MNSQKQAVALIAFLLIFAFSSLFAAVPSTINFQAVITDSAGNPINDTVDLTFKIYADSTTPTDEWVEIRNNFPIETELVQLELASITPFPVDLWDNEELWLGITINTDPEMSPRIQLLSVPYSLRAEGLDGHVKTNDAELLILGKTAEPPKLYLEDDPNVTPSIDEHVLITDLSVAIVVDRGSGDADRLTLEADELNVLHTDSSKGARLSSRSLELTSPDITLPVPSLPPPTAPDPFLIIADDVFGQVFASMHEAGRLRSFSGSTGGVSDLLPDDCSFFTDSGATLACRVGNAGLEVHGGSVDLLDGTDLTVTGTLDLTSGSLDLSGSGLIVGLDLDVGGHVAVGSTLTVNDGGSLSTEMTPIRIRAIDGAGNTSTVTSGGFSIDRAAPPSTPLTLSSGSSGGSVSLSDGSSGGTVTLTADDLTIDNPGGDLTVGSGCLNLEPSGGGAGGRIAICSDGGTLTDELGIDSLTFHRTDGLVLVAGASGTSAVYTAGGIQLTGPTAKQFAAHPTSISLTRPSNFTALTCDLDDATDLLYCDLDDDGSRDIHFAHTPSLEFHLESSTGFRCDGPTNLSSCDVSGAATYGSTVDISGGLTCTSPTSLTSCDMSGSTTCRSTWYCDVDDDATDDVYCDDLAPGPRLVVASGTQLRCDGPASLSSCDVSGAATYASSVDVGGTMTCTGTSNLSDCNISGTYECSGTSINRSSCIYDPDNDAVSDILVRDNLGTVELRVSSTSLLACDGPTELTDCDMSGTTTCHDEWYCDADDDAINDVTVTAGTTPTLTVAAGTDFECLGSATFDQPVLMNSDLQVNGGLTVIGPKAFVQEHPEDDTKEVVYIALEGNEAGTYTRGSSQLQDGIATINLPEDFRLVTNKEGLTAQVTPRDPVQSMLYVESITPTKLIVKASNKKDSNVKFDFMVNGVRAGYENHQVIRDKKSIAMTE